MRRTGMVAICAATIPWDVIGFGLPTPPGPLEAGGRGHKRTSQFAASATHPDPTDVLQTRLR